jgi:hypothetical protein
VCALPPLAARRLPHNKIGGTARELTGFVWAIMMECRPARAKRHTVL